MQDNSQLFNAMKRFRASSSFPKQQQIRDECTAILNAAEDPTAMVNYVESNGKHEGKSVLWVALATKNQTFITILLDRADLSTANVNAVAMSGEDRGKSVLWMATRIPGISWEALLARPDLTSENINSIATNPEDLNKSPLWNATELLRYETWREVFFKLLGLSNPTAINAVAKDGYNTKISVLERATYAIEYISERYDICNKMLAKGANVEPRIFNTYQEQMDRGLSKYKDPGFCIMQFTEEDLLKDNLQETINSIITNRRNGLAVTRMQQLEEGYTSVHSMITNLAFLIERPAQEGEDSNIKSELISNIGSEILSLVCAMVSKPLKLYAGSIMVEQLQRLKYFLQMLCTREGSILINHLQNITLANDVTKSLIDTCLLLSGHMLPHAVEKEYILQALEVCFVAPCLDKDAGIMEWRHFLATCYVQRDMPENAKKSVEWLDSELQGSFTEVAERIRNYKLPESPQHKKLRFSHG